MKDKNPNAVALGRLGGKLGGVRRAESLSKDRLSEIGRAGAAARIKKYGERWKDVLRERRAKRGKPDPREDTT